MEEFLEEFFLRFLDFHLELYKMYSVSEHSKIEHLLELLEFQRDIARQMRVKCIEYMRL